MLSEDDLNNFTIQHGGEYSLNHTNRILKIVSIIGTSYQYNHEVITLAAYLHDWGAYPPVAIKGVDHAQRSADFAAEFLEVNKYESKIITHICECIKYHHIGDNNKSLEAKLLSDADGIDFIGIIGVIRNFSTRPNELKKAYNSSKARLQTVLDNICLKESRSIIDIRIERMTTFFNQFDEESFGIF